MDINCTLTCSYQREGKCGLDEIGSNIEISKNFNNTECPYFSQQQKPHTATK